MILDATTAGSFRGRLREWANAVAQKRYHPEKHYMRGPGPATARKRPSPDTNTAHYEVKKATRPLIAAIRRMYS